MSTLPTPINLSTGHLHASPQPTHSVDMSAPCVSTAQPCDRVMPAEISAGPGGHGGCSGHKDPRLSEGRGTRRGCSDRTFWMEEASGLPVPLHMMEGNSQMKPPFQGPPHHQGTGKLCLGSILFYFSPESSVISGLRASMGLCVSLRPQQVASRFLPSLFLCPSSCF